MRWVGESPCGRLAHDPASSGHVAVLDPYMVWGPDGRRRSRTPMGVRASAVGTELPLFRDTWRLRTLPQAGSGSGAVGLVREEPDRWGLATPPFPRSYGQLRGSCLAAVRVGIPVTGYRQGANQIHFPKRFSKFWFYVSCDIPILTICKHKMQVFQQGS